MINRENLAKLAKVLDNTSQSVFDMKEYLVNENEEILSSTRAEGCGVIGCALGTAFINNIGDTSYRDWSEYCDKNFFSYNGIEFTWCFDAQWHYVDNTPQGAAKRIRYLIKHGKAPYNTTRQLFGRDPYIFASP